MAIVFIENSSNFCDDILFIYTIIIIALMSLFQYLSKLLIDFYSFIANLDCIYLHNNLKTFITLSRQNFIKVFIFLREKRIINWNGTLLCKLIVRFKNSRKYELRHCHFSHECLVTDFHPHSEDLEPQERSENKLLLLVIFEHSH
jgi:hypothetical protein